ncbi:MAG TPA: arsenate reductase (glutaredoxin) [Noviherbaspirillum sp.]|uniref:arsenate reductase (glutaredoxin) n=1 Tax=Noviherbaspirillum sp. TaxID=1926288 RepID=UPI002B48B0F3|nr:arsenate reductase (glutaredoxin) [Noviherbaspirillum sp.]HJV88419.1 arsenate reductase (glutaredoxin) [Noviherbaspirillum sp.]
MITIFHNPRCSKSREALALVEDYAARRQEPVDVVEYLKTPPTEQQLATLLGQLHASARDIVRSNEEEYEALGLAQADDAALLKAVAAQPKLLQRPIVVYKGRAVIGRPPERVRELLGAD